jgi:hypothetical protein
MAKVIVEGVDITDDDIREWIDDEIDDREDADTFDKNRLYTAIVNNIDNEFAFGHTVDEDNIRTMIEVFLEDEDY